MTTISQVTNHHMVNQPPQEGALTKTLEDTSQLLKAQYIFIKNCVLGTRNEKELNTLEGRLVELLATLPSTVIFIALDIAYVFVMMPALVVTYSIENQLNVTTTKVDALPSMTVLETPVQEPQKAPWKPPRVNFATCGNLGYNGRILEQESDSASLIATIKQIDPIWDDESLESGFQEFHKQMEHPCESEESCRRDFFRTFINNMDNQEDVLEVLAMDAYKQFTVANPQI